MLFFHTLHADIFTFGRKGLRCALLNILQTMDH